MSGMHHSRVVLLGPQRLQPTLNQAVASVGAHGTLATITAGWEERESEDQEMRDHLGGRTVNLRIYERADDVAERDPELAAALRERRDRLRLQHELYRLRLGHALDAARDLLRREPTNGDADILEAEREAAIEAVRTLDAFHLMRVVDVHAELQDSMRPLERDSVDRHRREIAKILSECGALCVAGGNVVALLHRMRLFDVLGLMHAQPIFAWSAGAMALSERIVLFHDSPPQGQGNAELFEQGLGAYPNLLPLPHARKRLHLHDRHQVALMARRFAPAQVIAFDALTRMDWDGKRWHGQPGTQRLTEKGILVPAGGA
jgi:hypothetical protein